MVTAHAVSRETGYGLRATSDKCLLGRSRDTSYLRVARSANDGRYERARRPPGRWPLPARAAAPVQYAPLHSLHMAPAEITHRATIAHERSETHNRAQRDAIH